MAPAPFPTAAPYPRPSPAILVEGLGCRLTGRKVLSGIGFAVPEKSFLGILGPNGSGKTALLRCLASLQAPSTGHVRIEGDDPRALRPVELAHRLAPRWGR